MLNVERPNKPTAPAQAGFRAAALKLAEQLGGSVVTITADDLPNAVLQYAARNNITQLVIGRAGKRRWPALFGRSLAHVLLERSTGAPLHVITDPTHEDSGQAAAPRRFMDVRWQGYVIALAGVAAANILAAGMDRIASGANLAMIFLLSVLLSGLLAGFGPAIFAAAAAAVTYNFFFLEPRLSFVIGHAADPVANAVRARFRLAWSNLTRASLFR